MSRCDSKALVILQIGAPAETKVYIFNVEAKLFNYAFDQTGHGELIQTHTHTRTLLFDSFIHAAAVRRRRVLLSSGLIENAADSIFYSLITPLRRRGSTVSGRHPAQNYLPVRF